MVEEKPELITNVPITAEAREVWLKELFKNELPHGGELFIPSDAFYANGLPRMRAKAMLRQLCDWLGIKPADIKLAFQSDANDHPDGKHYTLFVEPEVLHDEFVLGGFLAMSLTRYLVEDRKNVHLVNADQQGALLADCSISFGLGLVVINGINPTYGWLQTHLGHKNLLLKGFPLPNYTYMLKLFLRSHQVLLRRYGPALTPWAAQRLGVRPAKRPTHAVALVRQHVRLANLKFVGIIWLFILFGGIGIFVILQRPKPVNPAITTTQNDMNRLLNLKKLCEDSLSYDRQYTESTDIQTERVFNAEAARCKSLENQYQAAGQRYNQLTQ